MKYEKLKNNRGFSMIELMASIFILSFGIIVIYNVFSNFIVMTNTVSSRLTAVYLAKEGMEIVKNVRDNNFINDENWDNDINICSSGCQADYKAGTASETSVNKIKNYNANQFLMMNSDGFYGYDSGIASKFKRKITITSQGSNALKVVTQVFWNYNGKDISFETTGYLYNWY